MMGAYYELKCASNEDLSFNFVVTEDGLTGDPVDLQTYTPYMSICDADDTELLDCDAFVTIGGTDHNEVFIQVPAVSVFTLPVGTLKYDIVISDGTATQRLLHGYVEIIAGCSTVGV